MTKKISPVMIEALKLFCTDGIEIVTYYSLGKTHSAVRRNGLWHSEQISVKTLSALRERKLTTSNKIESTRKWGQSLTDSGKALCRELGIIKDEPTQETKPVEQAQPAIKIGDCFVKSFTSQDVVFVLTAITPSRFDDIGNGIFETANEAKQVHGLTYFLNSMLDTPRDKWRRATAEETKQILDAKMRQISDERQRLFDLYNELKTFRDVS